MPARPMAIRRRRQYDVRLWYRPEFRRGNLMTRDASTPPAHDPVMGSHGRIAVSN